MAPIPRETETALETITFTCHAPDAKAVSLIGDFNRWQPNAHPMSRQPDGSWAVELRLARGRHYYQFLVDGTPALDPHAMYLTLEDPRENVSFIVLV